MRLLEIIIVILLIVISFRTILPASVGGLVNHVIMGWLGILNIGILFIHGIIEGLHWQLVPVYILSAVFFIQGVLAIRVSSSIKSDDASSTESKPSGRIKTYGLIVFLLVIIGSSLALDALLPVFQLPTPTGEYQIGTTTFALTDNSRNETFTELPNDVRRIVVRAWYPTDQVTNAANAPYIDAPAAFGTGIQNSFGFPAFMVSHFPLVRTHSYLDVPVSESEPTYPVLLFSHGYGGLIMQNTVLMEEMASHGYIVFSINHPYESAISVFPDGTVIYEATEESLSHIGNSLTIWAEDSMFLLDQLEITDNGNIPEIFWDKLDLTRIGAMGHSFGGTTAEELCLIDSRVQTGISFDSPHIGNSLTMNMSKPFMLLFGPDYGNPEMNDTVYLRAEDICYGLYVNGTRHYNFADVSIWSPILKSFGLLGSIDGYRMLDLMNKYVLAFFDQYLIGNDSSLLGGPSAEYPEVMFYRNDL